MDINSTLTLIDIIAVSLTTVAIHWTCALAYIIIRMRRKAADAERLKELIKSFTDDMENDIEIIDLDTSRNPKDEDKKVH